MQSPQQKHSNPKSSSSETDSGVELSIHAPSLDLASNELIEVEPDATDDFENEVLAYLEEIRDGHRTKADVSEPNVTVPNTEEQPLSPKVGEPGYPPNFEAIERRLYQSDPWTGRLAFAREQIAIEVPEGASAQPLIGDVLESDFRKAISFQNLPANLLTDSESREVSLRFNVGIDAQSEIRQQQVDTKSLQLATKLSHHLIDKVHGSSPKIFPGRPTELLGFIGPDLLEGDGIPLLVLKIKVPEERSFAGTVEQVLKIFKDHPLNDEQPLQKPQLPVLQRVTELLVPDTLLKGLAALRDSFQREAEETTTSERTKKSRVNRDVSSPSALQEHRGSDRRVKTDGDPKWWDFDAELATRSLPSETSAPGEKRKAAEPFKWTPEMEFAAERMPDPREFVQFEIDGRRYVDEAAQHGKFRELIARRKQQYSKRTWGLSRSVTSNAADDALKTYFGGR